MYNVAIDVGNWKVKMLEDKIFDNGIQFFDSKPTLEIHTGFLNGKWFKAEETRKSMQQDFLKDDYLLYLIAVALAKEDLVSENEIHLILGTPFTNYAHQASRLKSYFDRKEVLEYQYEGKNYCFKIRKVTVYPQSFSAIAPYIAYYSDTNLLVVDIGSKTVDVLKMENAVPIESESGTFEFGTIVLLSMISNQLMRNFSREFPEKEIEKVLVGNKTNLNDEVVLQIKEVCKEYSNKLIALLQERGFDMDYSEVFFIGGGASVIREYLEVNENYSFDSNIFANVEGYMYLFQMQQETEV